MKLSSCVYFIPRKGVQHFLFSQKVYFSQTADLDPNSKLEMFIDKVTYSRP